MVPRKGQREVEFGSADPARGIYQQPPLGISTCELFRYALQCVADKNNPLLTAGSMSSARYLEAYHITVRESNVPGYTGRGNCRGVRPQEECRGPHTALCLDTDLVLGTKLIGVPVWRQGRSSVFGPALILPNSIPDLGINCDGDVAPAVRRRPGSRLATESLCRYPSRRAWPPAVKSDGKRKPGRLVESVLVWRSGQLGQTEDRG